ncbi:hypothetical protein ACIRD8_35190 [Streptomyces sp. NPDC102451]
MTAEEALLLAVLALGLADLLWITVGWLADRHLTHITYHRKENS